MQQINKDIRRAETSEASALLLLSHSGSSIGLSPIWDHEIYIIFIDVYCSLFWPIIIITSLRRLPGFRSHNEQLPNRPLQDSLQIRLLFPRCML